MNSFKGTITIANESGTICIDKSLFIEHPEFHQQVKLQAHVIAPGKMLISLIEENSLLVEEEYNPDLSAFLDFLERDITNNPSQLIPLTKEYIHELDELTNDVVVSDDEVIPDTVSL